MKDLKKGVQADVRFWSEAVKRKSFRKIFVSQHNYIQKILTQSVQGGVESPLMQDLAFCGVTGHIQKLDAGYSAHGLVVEKPPDHLLVWRDLNDV